MKTKVFLVLISIVFIGFAILHFSHALPTSLLTDALTSKAKIFQEFAPQGFGFYSKPPTEEGATFESEHLQLPTAVPSNIFGLSRYGRAQAIELGKVYEQIPKGYWISCEYENECEEMKKDINPYIVEKTEDMYHLPEGEYLIKTQVPISWYFRDYKKTTSVNRKMAKVVIK